MKKRLPITFLLVIFISFFLVACGPSNSSNDNLGDNVDKRLYATFQMAAKDGYEGTYNDWLSIIENSKNKAGESDGRVDSIIRTNIAAEWITYTITFIDGIKADFTIYRNLDNLKDNGLGF